MEKEPPYEEKVNKGVVAWDQFSFTYFTGINTIMNALMALCRINKKYNILDAGCGPGLGSKLITTDIPNYGSNVYALDFSPEMLSLAQKVFTEYDDFNANHHNHWEMAKYDSSSKVNVEKDLEEIRKTKIGKVVKFIQGNVESLVFEDLQFDVYISNFCLMLCVDVDRAIKEAYRVLKSDGVAAWSIWGKKEESKLGWCTFGKVLKDFGIDITNEKTSFWLAENPEALKQRFLNAGFREVRIEYSTQIYDCYDEQDFLVKFQGPKVNRVFEEIKDDTKVKEILEAVKNEAIKEVVENKQLPTLNTMCILAFK
jgi:ubiquinone/menaquinone biosynthesis C-methylase UbiE